MSKTTADCKAFLSQELGFDEKRFKRVRKFNNGTAVVREFSHPLSSEPILLAEENGQLALTTQEAPSIRPSLSPKQKLASMYVFSLTDENHENSDDYVLMLARRKDWEANGCGEYGYNDEPEKFLPPEWAAEDVNESGDWVIDGNLDADEIIATLHDLGCHSDAQFDELVQGRSALNCPLIERRKLQEVLDQTLADNNVTPNAKPKNKI